MSISTVTLPDVISPPETPEPDSQGASNIGLVTKAVNYRGSKLEFFVPD